MIMTGLGLAMLNYKGKDYGVLRHFQQYFSYIVGVSLIDG